MRPLVDLAVGLLELAEFGYGGDLLALVAQREILEVTPGEVVGPSGDADFSGLRVPQNHFSCRGVDGGFASPERAKGMTVSVAPEGPGAYSEGLVAVGADHCSWD